jgi:arylsulfatase A-like enzyme
VPAPAAEAPAAARRPNVLLVVSDDHGYDDVGCYGKTNMDTPVLDAAGVPVPERNGAHPVHGVSLLPHLTSGGNVPLPDRYLFWDLFGKMAVVHGRWKFVGEIPNHHGKYAAVPRIQQAQFELYDLAADLGETKDLANGRLVCSPALRRKRVLPPQGGTTNTNTALGKTYFPSRKNEGVSA